MIYNIYKQHYVATFEKYVRNFCAITTSSCQRCTTLVGGICDLRRLVDVTIAAKGRVERLLDSRTELRSVVLQRPVCVVSCSHTEVSQDSLYRNASRQNPTDICDRLNRIRTKYTCQCLLSQSLQFWRPSSVAFRFIDRPSQPFSRAFFPRATSQKEDFFGLKD